MSLNSVRVGDLAEQIRGVTYGKEDASKSPTTGCLPILRAGNITDRGLIYNDLVYVPKKKISPAQKLRRGDIVVAASSGSLDVVGKTAAVLSDFDGSFGAFCKVLRPNSRIDAVYFAHFFKTSKYRKTISSLASGANINNLRNEHLDELLVPLPPLPEQRRIAAILDKADALKAMRLDALEKLESLTRAIFIEMFGDPVANPMNWPVASLTDVCHCYSGGTPSKANPEYWQGTLPWFSAKDLKADDLFDSQDHIAQTVPESSNLRLLPKNTIVFCVRGMILAHTFQVSVLRIPATINQDLKALFPKCPIETEYLAECIRAQSNFVLQQVSEAGHGTKRLDGLGLREIRVMQPPENLQKEFTSIANSVRTLKSQHYKALFELETLFASLQHRAFRGEL